MKRVYGIAIFVLFLALVFIGLNNSNSITGAAIGGSGAVPAEFSSFGLIAAVIVVVLSVVWMRKFRN
jgi:hypothetical protein